jgi:hypothetical protein
MKHPRPPRSPSSLAAGALTTRAADAVRAQRRAMLASPSYRTHDRCKRSSALSGKWRRLASHAAVQLIGDLGDALQFP